MGFTAWGPAGPLGLVAATAYPGGYALVNGTGTLISWTAPNDGRQHRVMVIYGMNITVATTGGVMLWQFTNPAGASQSPTLVAATQATGTKHGQDAGIVQAGTVVSVLQNSAMTVGAATFYAELWAS